MTSPRNFKHTCTILVISEFLKRHSKAKRTRAPAYSQVLHNITAGLTISPGRHSGRRK